MNILMDYRTQRSAFFRIVSTKQNLKCLFESVPKDFDTFLYDALCDPSEDLTAILEQHINTQGVEYYVSAHAEMYLFFSQEFFDVVFISFSGTSLLERTCEKITKALAH